MAEVVNCPAADTVSSRVRIVTIVNIDRIIDRMRTGKAISRQIGHHWSVLMVPPLFLFPVGQLSASFLLLLVKFASALDRHYGAGLRATHESIGMAPPVAKPLRAQPAVFALNEDA